MTKEIKTIEELDKLDITDAGVIPFSFYKGEFYFLFGREAKILNQTIEHYGEILVVQSEKIKRLILRG